MYNLDGKVALVTGAGGMRGIGRAVAVRLAKEGASVVVVGRSSGPSKSTDRECKWRGLDSVVDEINALGCQAISVRADISQPQEVDEMMKKTLARFGKLDIMVNNAGVGTTVSDTREGGRLAIKDFTDEAWNTTLSVNLTGTFLCCRAAAREMINRGQGGKIVNISSIRGKVAAPLQGPYSASKFGVLGLTKTLALELAPYRINVNAVCPGATDTDIADKFFQREAERFVTSVQKVRTKYWEDAFGPSLSGIPLGRLGTPDDIANVVVFLVSEESNYVTGQAINVDGGLVTAY